MKFISIWAHSLRLHQWSKNLLIFVPLVLGHKFHDSEVIARCTIGFVFTGLCASAMYLVNDIFDVVADQTHPLKKRRGIASGFISRTAATVTAVVLLATALMGALLMDLPFAMVLGVYSAISFIYSAKLKEVIFLDACVIALLFCIRIILGTIASDTPWSQWLISFAGFFFLSLALAKRYAEIICLASHDLPIGRRGYLRTDGLPVSIFGIGLGLCSLVVMLIYMTNDVIASRLYPDSGWLFLIPLATLLCLMRIWLLAHRGELRGDPVVFVLFDPPNWLLGFLIIASFVLAL